MLHTVQRGENLLAIASKYNMGLADIMALNPSIASSGPDSIKVRACLPDGATVPPSITTASNTKLPIHTLKLLGSAG